jgi:hypothetical protein
MIDFLEGLHIFPVQKSWRAISPAYIPFDASIPGVALAQLPVETFLAHELYDFIFCVAHVEDDSGWLAFLLIFLFLFSLCFFSYLFLLVRMLRVCELDHFFWYFKDLVFVSLFYCFLFHEI